jgi:hypothetical protein
MLWVLNMTGANLSLARRQKEAQLQPHTRIDFTDNSVVPSSSSPCFLSFEAREEVKEAKNKPLDIRPEYSVSTSVGWAPEIGTKSLIQAMLNSQLSENQF